MACPHCSPIKGVKLTKLEIRLLEIVEKSPGITGQQIAERVNMAAENVRVHMSNIRAKFTGTDWCLSFGFHGYALKRGSRRSSGEDRRQSDSPPRSAPADDRAAVGEAAAHLLSLGC